MLWQVPDGRKIALISNSDAHSLQKLGREANAFDVELNYPAIIEAIKTKNPKKFLYTIEFFPEEGKYHFDGHRLCNIVLSPEETKKYHNICPVCGRALTVGVLNRIAQLADKVYGFTPSNAIPFKSLVGLGDIISEVLGVGFGAKKVEKEYKNLIEKLSDKPTGFTPSNVIPFKSLVGLGEIISEVLGVGVGAKKVEKEYKNLIEKFGSEFEILLETPISDLKTATLPDIGEGIFRVRQGKVKVAPGYDGVYGKVKIFSDEEKEKSARRGARQGVLF